MKEKPYIKKITFVSKDSYPAYPETTKKVQDDTSYLVKRMGGAKFLIAKMPDGSSTAYMFSPKLIAVRPNLSYYPFPSKKPLCDRCLEKITLQAYGIDAEEIDKFTFKVEALPTELYVRQPEVKGILDRLSKKQS